MNKKDVCEALKTLKAPKSQAKLNGRDLSALQRSIVMSMAAGAKLYSGPRFWLSTGFEAIVPRQTMWALLRKFLVTKDGRSKATQSVYKLTEKGRRWAKLPWVAILMLCFMLAGCGDSMTARTFRYGNKFRVIVYSGGTAVKTYVSTGAVEAEEHSDGWYFVDANSKALIHVSGTVVIEEIK